MAPIFRRSLLVLLSALGAGCGQDPGMSGSTNGVSSALDEAASENERHAAVCRHAGSLSDMLDDVTRHETAMNDLTARMVTARDQMRSDMGEGMACAEQGLDHMSLDLSDTNAEVAEHSKQMRGAATLGAGHFECAVHEHELRQMLESMRNDWGSMSCMLR